MKTKINPLHLASVSQCTLCPMLGEDHVPSSGNPHADLMIVGQSPGIKEVEKRQPFVGPCGEMVEFMLAEADLTRDEVYIANALKCHPPGNRKAMADELRVCRETWLGREIKVVNPSVILVLGKDAFLTLIPQDKGYKFGHMVEIKTKKRVYLVSYHPSYFLRRGEIEVFNEVGLKVRNLLDGDRSDG